MRWICLVLALAWTSFAYAASDQPVRAPEPAWVAPLADVETAPAPPGAPLHIQVLDSQVRFGATADEFYSRLKIKVLSPQGLEVGNLAVQWNPATDTYQLHHVRILRDGRAIDVLQSQKFTVLRREEGLESAVLDGALTGTLQVQSLQVGDVLEMAATVVRKRTRALRSDGEGTFPLAGSLGLYRVRAIWPKAHNLRWKPSADLREVRVAEAGDSFVVEHRMQDPKSAAVAEGAPPRFHRLRRIEFSGFSSWADVAGAMAPLYDEAAKLAPGSPVRAEAAKIAAASADPATRAGAALSLVQDRIRYVAITLDEGAYTPAGADETWTRRFGECKAKTALLLALLRELGISAEAALVSVGGGDGLNERLPRLGHFDHVLVRAVIGGKVYWLDGTRTGDSGIAALETPPYGWALPVRAAALEPLKPEPLTLPLSSSVFEVDARKGLTAPVAVSGELVLRGDGAVAMRAALNSGTPEDVKTALEGYWTEAYEWVTPEKVDWSYDEAKKTLRMTMTGEGEMEWKTGTGPSSTRWFEVDFGRFYEPEKFRRPRDQDQTLPFAVPFPTYSRWSTTIRLPQDAKRVFGFQGLNVREELGGYVYERNSSLDDDVFVTTRSVRTVKPEISAAEARTARERADKVSTAALWLYAVDKAQAEELRRENIRRAHDSEDPEQITRMAGNFLAEKDYARALVEYDRALAKAPDYVPAIQVKAFALSMLGKSDQALALVDDALKRTGDATLYRTRAAALSTAGRKQEALAAWREAARRLPNDSRLQADAAAALQAAGLRDEALALLDAAIKRGAGSAGVHQQRAQVLWALDRWRESLPDFEAALRLDPEDLNNRLNRGRWFSKAGQYDRALADFDEALRADPDNVGAHQAKAEAYDRSGRPAEAVEVFTAALARTPDSPQLLNGRCWQRALWGQQLTEAAADCEAALKLIPEAAGYIDSYALVAFRQGRYDEAIRRYDRALAAAPQMASSLYGRGLAKLRKGDRAGGDKDIAAAKALEPDADEDYRRHNILP